MTLQIYIYRASRITLDGIKITSRFAANYPNEVKEYLNSRHPSDKVVSIERIGSANFVTSPE